MPPHLQSQSLSIHHQLIHHQFIMALSSLNPRDVAAIDLARVLSRLEKKILSADTADPRLQHSSYERIKTSAVT